MQVWRTMTSVMRQRDAVGHPVAQAQRGPAILVLLTICFLSSPPISSADVAKESATSQTTPDDKEVDETGEFGSHGFNIVRVEQEDKIVVPPEKADEVWEFLQGFLANDSETLKKLDPQFTSYWSEELFTDTYFDSPTLQIVDKQGGVRHRRRVNLTNPNDVKNGRELMQIKVNDFSENELERGEIKFEIQYPTSINDPEDAHPMLGIVKRSHRDDFKQRLSLIGLDPYSMRPILTVSDIRRRVYVQRNNQPFLSVSFDSASSSVLWAKWHFNEIEPELNEVPFTEADEATQKYMEKINTEIIDTLMAKFPYLKRDLTPKYCKAFKAMESQIPGYRLFIKLGLDNADGMFLSGTACFAMVIGAFVWVKRISRRRQSVKQVQQAKAGYSYTYD